MRLTPLLRVVAVGSLLLGCLPADVGDDTCEAPIAASIEPLSSISCSERVDTGYRSGSAFGITVVTVDGRPVERDTANAYYRMAEAASAAGVEIRIVSGFRTMAEQEHLYYCYTSCSCNSCNLAARPGYSNHQSGHALDLNTSSPGVLAWLNAHGADYGFARTVPSEAWHWEWWSGGPGGGPCGPHCTPHCEGSRIIGADCGTGDCGVFGATCADDALGVRCVSVFCPARGDSTVCLDDTTIGNCHDGGISTGDCGAFAAYCSTAGGAAARCVSAFCVPSADAAPSAHDICMPDGTLAHCTGDGGLTDVRTCRAGTTCTATSRSASCVAPEVPAPDAGPRDAGRPDAGLVGQVDASRPDAGTISTGSDASTRADAGVSPPTDDTPRRSASLQGGCSASPGASSSLMLTLTFGLALTLAARRRRALTLALTALSLGACAPADDAVELSEHELTVCGRGPIVEGIDVSQWQSTIDWDAVGRSGIRYAIVRIGDGLGHDTQFDRNWAGAQRVGLLRGAYQFFRPSRDVNAQADIVVAAVGRLGPGDLPVTIDVEAPDPGVTPAQYTAAIHTWVDRVTAGTGRAPIVYTGRYYWDPYVASSDFNGLPLWHAQYTSAACPNINDRWSDWAFWQYTSTGSVSGITGNVDRNRWNGTYEELQQLAHVALCTPHCEGSTIVDASCGRGDCSAFGAGCAEDGPGARCVFFACPSLGDAMVCVDDHTLGTCHDGAITTGDCAAFAAYCGTAGATPTTARCVSVFCVPSADAVPVAHDICLPSGQLAHCNAAGAPEMARDCGAGTACVSTATSASCVDPTAMPDVGPPPVDAAVPAADAGGLPIGDGGTRPGDAGDAGVAVGGDASVISRPLSGGCACSSGTSGGPRGAWGLLAALALALGTRRRSR